MDYRLQLTQANVSLNFIKNALKDTATLDKFHFTTMLINILDNGVKYNNKSQKKLTVITENTAKGDFQIQIRDNGIGMTPETVRHIFEKFYRNGTPFTTQVKGLGLGLHYARQSATAHNWDIQVDSKPGTGSTFIITIPLQL